MPKLKPTTAKERQAFRRKLTQDRQQAFDSLCTLLDHPSNDLDWYHEFGTLLKKLIPEEANHRRLKGLLERPSKALGPSIPFLLRVLRFANLYPKIQDLTTLKKLGVDWTRLYIAFAVPDQDRHAFLEKALNQGWTIQQVRVEVQQQHPNRRRGVGGRPRSEPGKYGPEATLRESGRNTSLWLHHHQTWSKIKPQAWNELIQGLDSENREALRDLLLGIDRNLKRLLSQGKKVRGTVARLLQKI